MTYATLDVTWQGGRTLLGRDEDGHRVHMDLPESLGGEGTAPSPLKLTLFGLAGCTSMDVLGILEKKRQNLTGLTVHVEADRRETHPKIAELVRMTYIVEGDVTPKAIEDAIRLSQAKYCSVGGMLNDEVVMELYWRTTDGEPVEVTLD